MSCPSESWQPPGATRPQCPPLVRAPRPAQLLLAATALSAARQPAVIFEKEVMTTSYLFEKHIEVHLLKGGNAPPGWLAQCRLSSKSLREDPRWYYHLALSNNPRSEISESKLSFWMKLKTQNIEICLWINLSTLLKGCRRLSSRQWYPTVWKQDSWMIINNMDYK